MDGGAWWTTVHGVAKSQTWLNDFTFTFHRNLELAEILGFPRSPLFVEENPLSLGYETTRTGALWSASLWSHGCVLTDVALWVLLLISVNISPHWIYYYIYNIMKHLQCVGYCARQKWLRALVLPEVTGQPERQMCKRTNHKRSGLVQMMSGEEDRGAELGQVTWQETEKMFSRRRGSKGRHRSGTGRCVPSGEQLHELQDKQGGGKLGAGGVGESLMMKGLWHPSKHPPFLLNVKEHTWGT